MYIEIEINDINSLSELEEKYSLMKNHLDKIINNLKEDKRVYKEIVIEEYDKLGNEFYVKIKGEINLKD